MTIFGRTVRQHVCAACAAGFVGVGLLSLNTAGASPARQSSHFTSYRITTVASYESQPDQNLPSSTTSAFGRHEVIERMVVRDSTHYRVDVQTVLPGIDAGTLTVSLQGTRMVAYDSRSGIAGWTTVGGPGSPAPGDIQIGSALSPMAPMPTPGQSFQRYLAVLRQPGSVIHTTVHIVGHTRLGGHPVEIIDYGPLIGTGQPICARPTRHDPHPMCHSSTGTGRARLWVATDRPVLLRYTEGHFIGLPGGMMRQQFLYRTTSFQPGYVSLSATRYTPPVHAAKSTWLQTAVVGNGDSGWFSGWPELWRTGNLFRAAPPVDGHGNAYTEDGVAIRRDTLVPIPSAMNVLYYRPGPSAVPGMLPGQYRGKGPYVYLEERLQVHGLPAVLRHGRSVRRGRYTLWTGSFAKGLPWVALERGGIALLVTSNSLTEKDLIRYGFGTLAG